MAHFFCENCNTEVPQNAKTCPRCGKSFASILCPACGFAGDPALFNEGCPVCSYSMNKAGAKPEKPRRLSTGALPLWVYILTLIALLGVAAAFYLSAR